MLIIVIVVWYYFIESCVCVIVFVGNIKKCKKCKCYFYNGHALGFEIASLQACHWKKGNKQF